MVCQIPMSNEDSTGQRKTFMAEFSEMIKNNYGIKKTITTRNPQTNFIIERIYQVIGNIIKIFEIHEREIDESDPWKRILTVIMYTIEQFTRQYYKQYQYN